MALTMINRPKRTPTVKSKVRKNSRAWARTVSAPEGAIVTVYGERHMPLPRNWWSGYKPAASVATTPTAKPLSTKRKASEECDPACEQLPSKRACTTRTTRTTACASSPMTNVRTRSQTKASSLSKQVPLAANTSPVLPTHTVPPELTGIVPQFSKSGAHRCGRHTRKMCAPKWVACRDCRQTLPHGSMHTLTCGHALCRPCLNGNAARTKAAFASARKLKDIAENIQQHHAEGCLVENPNDATGYNVNDPYGAATPAPIALSPSPYAQPKAIVLSAPLSKALQTLGLWCCGMDTDLGQYGDCMEPANSAAMWLVDETLQTWLSDMDMHDMAKHRRCAWADCGSIIADRCIFSRDRVVGADVELGPAYLYCVKCSGVSLVAAADKVIPVRSS